MKHTRNIKPSQPYLHWSIALLFLFLTACGGGTTPDLGNQEGVEVSILSSLGSSFGTSDLGASEVTTQGVPSNPETGQTGVATAELEVYSGDTRLFFNEGEIVDEAQGQAVTLTPEDSDVSLSLPPGTYTFSLTAFDEREPANVLAKGEVEQQIGEDSRVSVPLTSLLGSARFEAPESVKGNEVFDALLSVSPPGREDLKVPLGDYTTAYEVQAPSLQLEGATNIGVRVAAACDAVEVTATVENNLSDTLNASTSVPISDEACAGSGNDVGTDLVLPFVSFTDLVDGDTLPQAFTLTGETNDMQSGMDKVEVYEGTAKLGDAVLDTGSEPVTWSFDYAPEREGDFTFIAVAFDKAGNSSRVEVKAQVDKDDTSTEVVEIPDEVLEGQIRFRLNKPEGELTKRDLEQITVIERDGVLSPLQDTIQNLEGLQFATNLELLDIPFNNVEDLTPLLNNPGLGEGDLINLSENGGVDTCPGSESREIIDTLLERGARVFFDEPENCDGEGGDSQVVQIPDAKLESLIREAINKPEGALTKQDLEQVKVIEFDGLNRENVVRNLEGLEFATNLEVLNIPFNFVSDLSPLQDLVRVTSLNFSENSSLEDIAPLVENENFGEDDFLGLEGASLELCRGDEDREDVATLVERGVGVAFDEPKNCDAGGDGTIVITSASSAASLEDQCTLRAAITAANTDSAVGGCPAGSGADTLILTPGRTYSLDEVDNETEGANGLPTVTSEITLEGGGATVERKEARGVEEVAPFRLLYIAESGNLTLKDVTLQRGAIDAQTNDNGGGIYNAGTLSVSASTLRDNDVESEGGALYNRGTATIDDTLITENAGFPAGIYNDIDGTITLNNTRIVDQNDEAYGLENKGQLTMIGGELSGNSDSSCCSTFTNYEGASATFEGTLITGNGGQNAIFINRGKLDFVSVTYTSNSAGVSNAETGIFTMTESTLNSNSGFGIWNRGQADIINSTVSGNGAQDDVVDLVNIRNYATGTLTIAYSTITQESYNTDDLSETALDNLVNEGGSVSVVGSIITNKLGGEDCAGDITSQGYNLDSDGSCSFAEGDLSSADPLLGPLQDNGGPTLTHTLQEGSPAIDAIPTDACEVDTDQRGVARPQGEACDIGAFEREQ